MSAGISRLALRSTGAVSVHQGSCVVDASKAKPVLKLSWGPATPYKRTSMFGVRSASTLVSAVTVGGV